MKKIIVCLLAVILISALLAACDGVKVKTETESEESLAADVSESVLRDAYANFGKDTNYSLELQYDYEDERINYIFKLANDGFQLTTAWVNTDTLEDGTIYENGYTTIYRYQKQGEGYLAMSDYFEIDGADANNNETEKVYYYPTKENYDEMLSNFKNTINEAFDVDITEATFSGKKVTKGSSVQYNINIEYTAETIYTERHSMQVIVKGGKLVSGTDNIEHTRNEDGRKTYESRSFAISYGDAVITMPSLEGYTYSPLEEN